MPRRADKFLLDNKLSSLTRDELTYIYLHSLERKIQTSASSQTLIFVIILINNLDCQGGSLALLVVVNSST
jgi:hypothetical protein